MILSFARARARRSGRRSCPADPHREIAALAERAVCGRAGERDWYDLEPAETHRAIAAAVESVRRRVA